MRFAIGVGSNRGDRMAFHRRAAELLVADGRVTVLEHSPLLENPAVGGPAGQNDFLNAVWVVETALGAHQLLTRMRRVEDSLGRLRSVSNGPRTIDLDLLLAADPDLRYASAVLEVPHPRMEQRLFVLEPLAAVAGHWRHPVTGCTVQQLLWRLKQQP